MGSTASLVGRWIRICGRRRYGPCRRLCRSCRRCWRHGFWKCFDQSTRPRAPIETPYPFDTGTHPGLCYRELQATLNAANGTLRHHLDVLQTRRSVTVLPVNGRTCYFAGAPTQIEILRGINVNEERAASALPIGLSLVQRLIVEDIVKEGIPRSQAALARRIGRSRATTHSAVKVLRRRGILREDRIEMMPHINMDIEWHGTKGVDYDWNDERR